MNKPANKQCYSYEGPVMKDGWRYLSNWKASTYASSEKQAINNLIFRFKQDYKIFKGAYVTLPGKITIVKGGIHNE